MSTTSDTATGYHESVDHLRRDLMRAYEQYVKAVQEHRPQTLADTTPMQATAYMSSLAAQSYSYTLAAVLGYAAREFGPEVAHALACVADDVMENGDDNDLNGDVLPS